MRESSTAERQSPSFNRSPILKLTTGLLLLAFCVLYWAQALHVAPHMHLAGDDVFTLWMIRSPSLIAALKLGADTAPPGFYWLMRASAGLFGYTPLGIRAPALIAVFVFVAAIFLLLRRHVGSALAGAAAILPMLGSAGTNEFFARPPALMMACFALLCLVWEHDRTPNPKLWRAGALAAILGFAISVHFYSVLFVPLLASLEVVWTSEHRTLRKRYWIAIIAGAAVLLLWLPVIGPIYRMTHASAKSPAYYAHPTPAHLFQYLGNIGFSNDLLAVLLVLLLLGGAFRWRQIRGERPLGTLVVVQRTDNLGAVGFAAALYPLLTYAFTLIVTHVFNERYIVSCALGLSIALTFLVRSLGWPRRLELLLLATIVAIYARDVLSSVRHPVSPYAQVDLVMQSIPGNDPIALPDGGSFFAAQESFDPAIRARTVYLFLPNGISDPDTEPSRIAKAWHTLRPELPIYASEDFLGRHNSFYIVSWGTPGEGLVSWASANLHTQIVEVDGDIKVYRVTQS